MAHSGESGRARARLGGWLRIEGGVSLRLRLDAAPPLDGRYRVVELSRAAVAPSTATRLPTSPDALDEVAPLGWRLFVAYDGERLVHRSAIVCRAGRPLLFAVETVPEARGRGAFRATVAALARTLVREGERTLLSSTSLTNHASRRAHAAAGFVEVGRTLDVVCMGVSVRHVLGRLRDRLQLGRPTQ